MPTQEKFKKRAGSCPSLGCSSCSIADCNGKEISSTQTVGIAGVFPSDDVGSHVVNNVKDDKKYKTRLFYNKAVVPGQVDALLAARHQKCQLSNTNTIRSRVFSRTVQQIHGASFDAGCVISRVTHNDLGPLIVHSDRGVGGGIKCHDIDIVENSPQKPAKITTPGLESGNPGFESPLAGYESCDHEVKHCASGCVSGDGVMAEPNGHEFESSQATVLAVPIDIGKNCANQTMCLLASRN